MQSLNETYIMSNRMKKGGREKFSSKINNNEAQLNR